VLTGAHGVFSGGDDLKEVAAATHERMMERLAQFHALYDCVEGCRVPVIAAIDGPAMGGGMELALACDIRFATPRAQFAASGVNIGLMASVHRLPRLIGLAPAKSMLLTGLPVSAAQALDCGLVAALCEPDSLLSAALTLAERIASRSPLAVEAAKRQSNSAMGGGDAPHTSDELAGLVSSLDHREAVAAFLEKRAPGFKRR
jgi:enoyl-CoA hydratase/carnithine racemase